MMVCLVEKVVSKSDKCESREQEMAAGNEAQRSDRIKTL